MKGSRIKIEREETCEMMQNKMVQPRNRRHQGMRKELERNGKGKTVG